MILAFAVPIELSIFLAAFSAMGGVIAFLAKLLWSVVQSKMDSQDKLIAKQDELIKKDSDLRLHYVNIIDKMQVDIDRLASGCGNLDCQWRKS